MSFAFLYPLAWIGALAIAAPIWLHLRRKSETDVVRFSAMRFLDDQPVARARPLWPHKWPLLLLRLLALMLLIAAFSWPYIPSDRTVVVRESRIYILDNTLSHQTNGGFEDAREKLAKELEKAGAETQIAVIELTSQPRLILGFGDEHKKGAEILRQTTPSHQRGSYLAAFRMAERLLQQSLGERRHIVLIGDSQENQWKEGGNVPPFLKDIDVTLPKVEDGLVPNLSVTQPDLQRVSVGKRALVECAVTVSQHGDFESTSLVFHANGQDVVKRVIELKDQPDSMTFVAQWEVDPVVWLRGHIRIESQQDVLAADDRVVFSMPPIRLGKVGLLARSPYLQTALSPEVMQGRWKTYTGEQLELAQDELDVLCLESQFLSSTRVRAALKEHLHSGRGAVLIVDQLGPVTQRYLQELGIESLSLAVEPGQDSGLRYVFMEHNIFQPFRSADFGDLNSISINKFHRLRVPGALPLVFAESGDPLLFESDHKNGRLLVFAFALERASTSWTLHPTFVPLLDRCLSRVRDDISASSSFEPGETCLWPVPAGRDTSHVTLVRDGFESRASVEDGQARLKIPDDPGLYDLVYDNDKKVEAVIAVNPPANESVLSFTDPAPMVNTWIDNSGQEELADLAQEEVPQSIREVLQQNIWWWLVLGGLGALLIESTWLAIGKATA